MDDGFVLNDFVKKRTPSLLKCVHSWQMFTVDVNLMFTLMLTRRVLDVLSIYTVVALNCELVKKNYLC